LSIANLFKEEQFSNLKTGDLISVSHTYENKILLALLHGNKIVGDSFAPLDEVGIWLGCEFIDMSVDLVECGVVMIADHRYAFISGAPTKL
jgi:hypothetical protein